MDLSINFFISGKNDIIMSEKELQTVKLNYNQTFGEFQRCEGGIQIWSGNDLTNQIEDELPALVKNLCFESVAEIYKNGNAEYFYFNQDGSIYFNLQDSEIVLSGIGVNTITYPFKMLLSELIQAGERFISLLDSVATDTIKEEEDLKSLSDFLKAEREKSHTHINNLK